MISTALVSLLVLMLMSTPFQRDAQRAAQEPMDDEV